ncbi:hypothetical protein Hanom_Chr08g00724101 [Helianthus anomalus]
MILVACISQKTQGTIGRCIKTPYYERHAPRAKKAQKNPKKKRVFSGASCNYS